jgi:hypothetical protein
LIGLFSSNFSRGRAGARTRSSAALHHLVAAARLDLAGDGERGVGLHRARDCAGLARILEHAHGVETHLSDELEQLRWSSSVSPGKPEMNVVRIAMPGTRSRSGVDELLLLVAVTCRRIASSMRSLACCSGMSM